MKCMAASPSGGTHRSSVRSRPSAGSGVRVYLKQCVTFKAEERY
jgi:hypothetical protein